MNHYVFRINYDEAYWNLREEILKGRLRQGWGGPGFDLTKGVESYVEAYEAEWGSDGKSESDIKKRYRILSPMLNMRVGDLIVLPKMNTYQKTEYLPRAFTIVRVIGRYYFDIFEKYEDFGHVIPIEIVASFSYGFDDNTRTIQNSFSGYQRCVNNVLSEKIAHCMDELCKKAKNEDPRSLLKSHDPLQAIDDATRKDQEKYIDSLVETIKNWSGITFERVLESLFKKQGFTEPKRNQHDNQGGDIDLWYSPAYPADSLMDCILDGSGLDSMPEIRIQAKCKERKDLDDVHGINQLKSYEGAESAINIFITTASEISKEAESEAEGSVVLIDAEKLARLIMKYGLGNEIL